MQTTPDSTNDDVAAAFAAAAAGAPPSQGQAIVEPAFGSEPAAPAPASRDEHGRFRPRSDATGGPAAAPTPGVAAPVATPAPGGDPAAPVAPAAAPAAGPAAPVAAGISLDPSKPPQGWRPEVKEKWSSLPEDIRQEIVRREEDSAKGVAKLRQQFEPATKVFESVAQHQQYFEHIQREPAEYLQEVIQIEQTIALGNPAQKMQALLELGDRYGVPLRQVIDSAMGGKLNDVLQQSHHVHKTPAQLPPEVARELHELRQARQEMVEQAAAKEYEAFVSDPNRCPFIDEAAGDMADLLEKGLCSSYEEAYDMAVWRNPSLRQRSIAHANGQSQAQGIIQRQQAAGLVSTPAAASIQPSTPGAPETTEDAVRQAWMASQRG